MKTNLPTLPTPTYPHTIDNGLGETLTFLRLLPEPDGDRLLVENSVAPNQGPPMHTHLLQDEGLTVVEGRLAYEVPGQPIRYAGPGDSVVFERGTPHRFWNAGDATLRCTGWIKPAHTIVFFLSAVFDAQVRSGQHQPEQFDAAYLLTRYAREYDMADIPGFVKRVVLPATYQAGRLLGKYRKFRGAPVPVRA